MNYSTMWSINNNKKETELRTKKVRKENQNHPQEKVKVLLRVLRNLPPKNKVPHKVFPEVANERS